MVTKGTLLRWSGASPDELPRVLRCMGALFFLLLSYYLVKPLRNSQFLKEFAPHALPWVYLVVSGLSLLLTRGYQELARRVSRPTLMASTFLWAAGCKVVFWATLSSGGHLWTALFYMWASVYFLLLAAALWGCLNERFSPGQAERCFAFIALGATLGGICGSLLAGWLGALHWSYGTLLLSAGAVLVSLALLWPELRFAAQPRQLQPIAGDSSLGWLSDRYLRAIGTMVLVLAVYTTVNDLISQRVMDRQVGRQVFAESLPEFASWKEGANEFSHLRQLNRQDRAARLQVLAEQQGRSRQQLESAYQTYQRHLELELRGVFSTIFTGQGILGILILTSACRPFIRQFGVGNALTVLPTFAAISLLLLLLPLQVGWLEVLLIVGGALNYSFNNATKEMLYTVTSPAALVHAKPVIEGPVMRLGDVFCALLVVASGALMARFQWSDRAADALTLLPCLVLIGLWWRVVRSAGRAYQLEANRRHPDAEASPRPT